MDDQPRSERRLEHADLPGQIIGAAISVHRALGPGFLESVYGNALAIEFEHHGLPHRREPEFRIHYRDREVGRHRPDFLVADLIVVELKAVRALDDTHLAILRSYLQASRRRHGLLLNFARPRIEIRRIFLNR